MILPLCCPSNAVVLQGDDCPPNIQADIAGEVVVVFTNKVAIPLAACQ